MKKYSGILLATAGGMAAASGAQAADIPLKAAAPAYVPAASWAGFYVGAHAGVAWSNATGFENGNYASSLPTTNDTGFIGGGQIGYNWQHGNFVYGVEADGSGLSNSAKFTDGNGYSFSHEINWLATFRGRAGLAVGDTMGYVTGGLAIGGVKNSSWCGYGACVKSESTTRVGWVVGGGIEHMWNRNWTIGLEALFVDLGTSDLVSSTITGTYKSGKFSNQAVIGRVKLNYKF
jgi:outer membrane immunogenic protein